MICNELLSGVCPARVGEEAWIGAFLPHAHPSRLPSQARQTPDGSLLLLSSPFTGRRGHSLAGGSPVGRLNLFYVKRSELEQGLACLSASFRKRYTRGHIRLRTYSFSLP